jgi:hypothetical protein
MLLNVELVNMGNRFKVIIHLICVIPHYGVSKSRQKTERLKTENITAKYKRMC